MMVSDETILFVCWLVVFSAISRSVFHELTTFSAYFIKIDVFRRLIIMSEMSNSVW